MLKKPKSKRFVITCTAYDKSGRIICIESNSYTDSCRLMRFFAKRIGDRSKNEDKKIFNHAEIKCIDKAMKSGKIVHMLKVERIENGLYENAKPCNICQFAIKYFRIKKVIYSTREGFKEL